MKNNIEDSETKQDRREKRAKKKKESMLKYGKSLAKVYKNATLKRLRGKKSSK